jgi:Protein of unknown function (DUF3987)
MQVPADYVAVAVMVAAGSAIGRRVGIHPKRHDDWLVVPNLWGSLIGRPGLLKSPSLEEALRPIKHMECEAKAKYEAEMKVWEIREEIEKQAKNLRAGKIREQLKGHRNFDALAQEIAEEQTEAPVPGVDGTSPRIPPSKRWASFCATTPTAFWCAVTSSWAGCASWNEKGETASALSISRRGTARAGSRMTASAGAPSISKPPESACSVAFSRARYSLTSRAGRGMAQETTGCCSVSS